MPTVAELGPHGMIVYTEAQTAVGGIAPEASGLAWSIIQMAFR